MNYYNPYFFNTPSQLSTISNTPKVGLFTRLFGENGIKFSNIINSTQRVLSFANQAIPFVKQVKPIIGNAKTMFKVMNEFKRSEYPKNNQTNINSNKYSNNLNKSDYNQNNYSQKEGPTFFV